MPDRSLKYALAGALFRLPLTIRDRLRERGHPRAERQFLVVRHPGKRPRFYDVIVDWVTEHVPELRGHFDLRWLPCRVADWSRYALHIPWLQDPVENWSLRAYEQASRLGEQFQARGIPVVNRVERLAGAAKSTAAKTLARLGIRTPSMRPIHDVNEFRENRLGLSLPLFVREDLGHGGPILRADTDREVHQLPIHQFHAPVAVELVDVQSPADGLFRKYRYVTAGSLGVPHHMQATQDWITKGDARVHTPEIHDEELAFVSRQEPVHELFQQARRALGLDVVAFDYGYDRTGKMVVWEVNPYPHFHIPRRKLSYLAPAMHRTLAAVVHLYFEKAGMDVPERLAAILHDSPAVARSRVNDRAAA
jgi:hypothetical protein